MMSLMESSLSMRSIDASPLEVSRLGRASPNPVRHLSANYSSSFKSLDDFFFPPISILAANDAHKLFNISDNSFET